ncbi:hypothetical protein EDD15DRAFT_2380722 [Pisolithus albus]|nr:hypothetical protein EDD15DRAFT_2380722 [Pisolithus albus]
MADIPCLACGKIVWGDRGLSMHSKRWCPYKKSADESLLREYRERTAAKEVELERLRCLQEEEDAERHRVEQEREALHMQRLTEFTNLGFDGPDSGESVERRPSGLPRRNQRLPKRYRDELPVAPIPPPVAHVPDEWDGPQNSTPYEADTMDEAEISPGSSNSESPLITVRCTHHNRYGMFREYQGAFPTYDPESSSHLGQLCDSHDLEQGEGEADDMYPRFGTSLRAIRDNYFKPFLNVTVWRLMGWFYSGSNQKSIDDLNNLVHNVILAEDFSRTDLQDFVASRELKRLDESTIFTSDLWHTASVTIRLPCEKVKVPEERAPEFHVEGLHYRKLTEVIKSAFAETSAKEYNAMPYKLYWQPDDDAPTERVFSEVYTADVMLEEHERIKGQPHDCSLETVVAGVMIWSDSTHLANFGNAALWPIYLFLGNQSKYICAKPNAFAAHHLAYIPKLPDTIQDYYKKIFGTSATAAVLTHCKWEVMQAIWKFLLDDDFINAYEHGMVIEFPDGVSRRVFPRLLTYSADYPEKTLLATLKFLGRSPCPCCLVQKNTIFNLGAKKDRYIRRKTERVDDERRHISIENTCKAIFKFGRSVLSTAVENILGMLSATPTRNAFSEKLSKFGLNFFRLFVPDFMHEFELGVWKAILTHLIRIIYEVGDNCIQEFKRRFRLMPTFGRGTIRKFSNNVSDLSKLAARDFEDILQSLKDYSQNRSTASS